MTIREFANRSQLSEAQPNLGRARWHESSTETDDSGDSPSRALGMDDEIAGVQACGAAYGAGLWQATRLGASRPLQAERES